MKWLLVSTLLLASGLARAQTAPCPPGATARAGDVQLSCVAEGVWLFTAFAPSSFQYPGYPANGLVIEAPEHAVLVDTGWIPAQADSLAAWSEAAGRPIRAAVVTHFHEDRVGGIEGLSARGIPVFGTALTIELAGARGEPVPTHELTAESFTELSWFFPGPAHSPDNIVVWHESSRTLFGGCLVKDFAADSMGNLADADVMNWPAVIDSLGALVGTPSIVVPGHGLPGDALLLQHTLELLGPRECSTAADCVVTIEALDGCACCSCVPPRAMSVAAVAHARETMRSCDPICPHPCPPCTTPEELARLAPACELGQCVIVPAAVGPDP